jgi:3-oxoacyl-[acyl-carrier-protein] synthase-3
MVIQLAERAGLTADQLYFNIEKVGNTSSASIPLAIHDAVRDGVIGRPLRVFAPGFGAGAVAGYAVMRVDPAVVAVQRPQEPGTGGDRPHEPAQPERAPASEDVRAAFG